jgi:hypothetical protein
MLPSLFREIDMTKTATKKPVKNSESTKRASASDKVKPIARVSKRASKPRSTPPSPARPTKQQAIISALQQPNGATIASLSEKTGWQPHSVRGFLAGQLKKLGIKLQSEKTDGERRYRIPAGS